MDTKIKVMNETYLILSNPHILVRLNTAANRVKHQKTIEKRLFEESTPIHNQFGLVIRNIEPANPGLSLSFLKSSVFSDAANVDRDVYTHFSSYYTEIQVDKDPKGNGYTNKVSLIHKGQEMISKTFTGQSYLFVLELNEDNDYDHGRRWRPRLRDELGISKEDDMETTEEVLTPFKLSLYGEFNLIENKYQRYCVRVDSRYEETMSASTESPEVVCVSFYLSHIISIRGYEVKKLKSKYNNSYHVNSNYGRRLTQEKRSHMKSLKQRFKQKISRKTLTLLNINLTQRIKLMPIHPRNVNMPRKHLSKTQSAISACF
jgi:hypothetical protein